MAFMVIFRTGDGKPGYHQADDLDAGLRFVEHLRNNEGVDNARVYRLEEIPIEVKTVYRVEVARTGDAPAAVAPPPESPAEAGESVEPAPTGDAIDPEPVGAAKRGLFR